MKKFLALSLATLALTACHRESHEYKYDIILHCSTEQADGTTSKRDIHFTKTFIANMQPEIAWRYGEGAWGVSDFFGRVYMTVTPRLGETCTTINE